MVSEIPPTIARHGSRTQGGLTPDFFARSKYFENPKLLTLSFCRICTTAYTTMPD